MFRPDRRHSTDRRVLLPLAAESANKEHSITNYNSLNVLVVDGVVERLQKKLLWLAGRTTEEEATVASMGGSEAEQRSTGHSVLSIQATDLRIEACSARPISLRLCR